MKLQTSSDTVRVFVRLILCVRKVIDSFCGSEELDRTNTTPEEYLKMSSDENSENIIYGCGSNPDELAVSKLHFDKLFVLSDARKSFAMVKI